VIPPKTTGWDNGQTPKPAKLLKKPCLFPNGNRLFTRDHELICIHRMLVNTKPKYSVINDITLCRLFICKNPNEFLSSIQAFSLLATLCNVQEHQLNCIKIINFRRTIKTPTKINKKVIILINYTNLKGKQVNHNALTPHSRCRANPNLSQLYHSQQGGGLNTHKANVIDLTSSEALITRYDNVIYPDHTRQLGILSVTANLTQKTTWRPPRYLPVRRSNHPLEQVLNPQMAEIVIATTRQLPNDVILYPTSNRIQNVTTTHMQQLLTHGSMATDSILNTFLKVFSANHNLKYLNTFF
jgi:hypothetical protein